jgi:hypothetical protein
MKLQYIITIILLCSTSLFAFNDQDIDGVEDSKDQCINTPFDVIVDEKGCPYNTTSLMKNFTLQIGKDFSFNHISERSDTFNVFFNYMYKTWFFSLASSNYNTTHINTVLDTEDDLYLTIGHLFQKDKLNTKVSIGTKFAFMDDDSIDRDNDFFISTNFDYFINQKQNIFLYHSYTWSGDSERTDYENFHSFSLGTGYAFTDKWYSALSYNYAQSSYQNAKSYRALSWFNYYALPNDFYISCNYARTLNNSSYDHMISFNIGVKF